MVDPLLLPGTWFYPHLHPTLCLKHSHSAGHHTGLRFFLMLVLRKKPFSCFWAILLPWTHPFSSATVGLLRVLLHHPLLGRTLDNNLHRNVFNGQYNLVFEKRCVVISSPFQGICSTTWWGCCAKQMNLHAQASRLFGCSPFGHHRQRRASQSLSRTWTWWNMA